MYEVVDEMMDETTHKTIIENVTPTKPDMWSSCCPGIFTDSEVPKMALTMVWPAGCQQMRSSVWAQGEEG